MGKRETYEEWQFSVALYEPEEDFQMFGKLQIGRTNVVNDAGSGRTWTGTRVELRSKSISIQGRWRVRNAQRTFVMSNRGARLA